MRAISSYILGFIGALGFSLAGIGAYNPKYSLTEILSGSTSVNTPPRVSHSHQINYNFSTLNKKKIDFLRRKITRDTIHELSDLVKANPQGTPEAGGELRLSGRVRVYEALNENSKIIKELEGMDLQNPGTLNYMRGLLDSRFSGTNACMAENADVGWQYRIGKTREAIDNSQRNFGDPVSALNNLIDDLRDTYVKGETVGKPRGVFLGDLHTHDDSTTFSDVDLCISNARTLFLVSHNYPTSNVFNLYAAQSGRTFYLGKYDLN